VRTVRDDARLTIVLADPERRNAFSAVLREALLEALMLAEADDTITQVDLSGDGPAFCSGGDLDEFGAATDLTAAYLVRLSRAPGRIIDRIGPKVTVHAHGASIGAGTEMLAFARTVTTTPGRLLPATRGAHGPGSGRRRLGQRHPARRQAPRRLADAVRDAALRASCAAVGAHRSHHQLTRN
jgi:enoyl-CoA hydratase/carnithine racemase